MLVSNGADQYLPKVLQSTQLVLLDKEKAQYVFDCVRDFIEMEKKDKNIPEFLEFILSENVLLNKNVDEVIKEMCFDVIQSICECRRSYLTKPAIL